MNNQNETIIPLFCCNEYKVSNMGIIYSKYGKEMRPSINHNGYLIYNFMIDGKRIGIAGHTCILKSFCPLENYDNMEVNHINGNKTDNKLSNLEWCTSKENARHSIDILGNNKGLKNGHSKKVYEYDKNTNELIDTYNSVSEASKEYTNNNKKSRHIQSIISNICLNKGKKSYKNHIYSYTPIHNNIINPIYYYD